MHTYFKIKQIFVLKRNIGIYIEITYLVTVILWGSHKIANFACLIHCNSFHLNFWLSETDENINIRYHKFLMNNNRQMDIFDDEIWKKKLNCM